MNHTRQLQKNRMCKVYSFFKDNIWGADLADMPLISKYNKGVLVLLVLLALLVFTLNILGFFY